MGVWCSRVTTARQAITKAAALLLSSAVSWAAVAETGARAFHFESIAEEILVVKAPGPNVTDPAELPYRRLRPGLRSRPAPRYTDG